MEWIVSYALLGKKGKVFVQVFNVPSMAMRDMHISRNFTDRRFLKGFFERGGVLRGILEWTCCLIPKIAFVCLGVGLNGVVLCKVFGR